MTSVAVFYLVGTPTTICFLQNGFSPKECLQEGKPGISEECRSLQVAFFECKRSLVSHTSNYLCHTMDTVIAIRTGQWSTENAPVVHAHT